MLARLSVGFCVAFLAAGSIAIAAEPLVFRDVAAQRGLMPALAGINGHGAGWGDLDGDGFPELYVGTFDRIGATPNVLFQNARGMLVVSDSAATRVTGRANTIAFVDLDNDGDLDVYLTNLGGGKPGYAATDNKLFRNDAGRLSDVSAQSGACPEAFRGRGVSPVDLDGDGDLDLLLAEGVQYGSARRSRVIRNLGGLKFADVTEEVGLPTELPGLGVATGDLNQDGWPDAFLSARDGGNRLFLNDGAGRLLELPGSAETFAWKYQDGDDTSCGVCFGDLNLDGLTDIVVGHHYDRPWVEPVPVRLFLNRGSTKGVPKFEDVTAAAGLVPLPLKAPHVEVQDFDNDGIPDISTSQVKFANGQPHPVIFRGLGVRDGVPRFDVPALAVNDFPTAEDRATKGSGAFFKKMLAEGKITYTAPAPTADFDRDGRLDMILPNWFPEASSLLLKNETPGGHWLEVVVRGNGRVNRMGIGCRVQLVAGGEGGEGRAGAVEKLTAKLIGHREISIGYGYASGQEAIAHFGLGERESCDVVIDLPHQQGRVVRRNVRADQRVVIEVGTAR